MDEGLFARHALQIRKQQDAKRELILRIKETTGISIEESEIVVSKKQVTLHLSSVKKSKLLQKKVKEILETQGYTLRT
jgi:hypothetical protein